MKKIIYSLMIMAGLVAMPGVMMISWNILRRIH